MVKTRGGSSAEKRTGVDSKAATFASKRPRKEASPSPSFVATEATKSTPLPIQKGVRQKARASKPLKDLSKSTSLEMLMSGPNSPLPKLPLSSPSNTVGSPSGVISGAAATSTKQPAQPSSPVATPSPPHHSQKPSSSKPKKKGKVVGSPPRYSLENSYSKYFFEF